MADKPVSFQVNAETGEHSYVELSPADLKTHQATQKEMAALPEPVTMEERVAAAVAAALKAALPDVSARQIKAAEQAARKSLAG